MVKKVLEQRIEEGNFVMDDPVAIARLFFIAFGSNHLRGPMILEREHEEVVKDAEAMYAFLLKSIKRV